MFKKTFLLCLICLSIIKTNAQTTDLAVLVEAQSTSNVEVSQVHIYQEFQYLITILNSGNLVENATFLQDINPSTTVVSYEFLNGTNGAGTVTDFVLNADNELSGTVTSLPANSSIEVKVTVIAPTFVGGIATDVTVSPPNGTTDSDPSNNQSIISLDVVDVPIDFTVSLTQITPTPGTAITAWGDDVTYRFTITNRSSIAFPLDAFTINMGSNPIDNGEPNVQVQSIACMSTTNGVTCPENLPVPSTIFLVDSGAEIYSFNQSIVFPINGTITFEIVCKFLEGECAEEPDVINVDSFVELELSHDNESPNASNITETLLLTPEGCLFTDLVIETEVLIPTSGAITNWNDIVTLETVVSNLGSFDVPIRFFLQNLSSNAGTWDLISVTCLATTGPFSCNDITFSLNGETWNTNNFLIPAGGTITVETVLNYLEPNCSPSPQLYTSQIRSAINILDQDIIDIDYSNNFDDDFVTLLQVAQCPFSDLSVTKTQITPQAPLGTSDQNPMPWEDVTYEITVTNVGDEDTFMTLKDSYGSSSIGATGILRSVECISASGGASCNSIAIQNIDVEITQNSTDLIFWEITQDDGWSMPSGASVTFRTVHSWIPNCDNMPIPVVNRVNVSAFGGMIDGNQTNNSSTVTTYFTPCVDLIIQTLPSVSTTPINSTFNWIVDITNSNTSSTAIDAIFSNDLNPIFTIMGTPSCQVVNGSASCISNFTVNGSNISGTVPSMEANSTIRILIPVMAPNFGGVFNNRAEITPSAINNEELTPETNISISNVQVISPMLTKHYNPETIVTGQQSTLTFTIHNLASNPAQNEISFIDNLAPELTLVSPPSWVNANGCTATFVGNLGDSSVGVSDLTFPEGVENCTFSVEVTSNTVGVYLNDNSNFSSQNNINTTQTEATLTVIEDTSNVDIEVLKAVSTEGVSMGDEVDFTISVSNLGTTMASQIEISENLPVGYEYLSHTTTLGNYDPLTGIWSIGGLNPNQSENLVVSVRVISSVELQNTAYLNGLNEVDRDETNNEDSASVTVDNCLKIPQGISPNNDGKNDVLVIPCIALYPQNTLKIFNRLGTQVYEKGSYNNDWNGIANMGFPKSSRTLPTGTYFYILRLSKDLEPIFGWVYINY